MGMILESIRQQQLKDHLPAIHPGDTVRVHVKVVEGNRERIQVFEGTVIKLSRSGPDRGVTVRRLAHGIGVERTFLLNSPRVDKIEVTRLGDVRRARLYYLRDRVGKSARIKEKRIDIEKRAAQAARSATPVATPEPPTELPVAEVAPQEVAVPEETAASGE